jgi:O-antigen/teichoic acid export membrane protein
MGIGLWAAAVLGPTLFGRWNILATVVLYASYAHLGVVNAMGREIPVALGGGDRERVRHVESTVLAAALVAAAGIHLVSVVSLLVPSVRAWAAPEVILACGLAASSALLFGYFIIRARSKLEFASQGIQLVAAGAIMLASYAAWGRHEGLLGLALCTAAGHLTACALGFLADPARPHFAALDRARLAPLLAVGFPLLSAGVLFSLLTTLDRWVILRFMGVASVGHYTLAIVAFGAASLPPLVVSQLTYPRMGIALGRLADSRHLGPLVVRHSLLASVAAIGAIAVVGLALEPLVERFLPAYGEGVAAGHLILLGAVAVGLATGPANFLNTTGQHVLYLKVQAGGVLANAALSVAAALCGMGIAGVAAASSLSLLLYAAVLAAATAVLVRRRARTDR